MHHKHVAISLLVLVCLAVSVLPLPPLHAAPSQRPVRLGLAGGGDLWADVAVGVPGEDVGDTAADAGAVNLLYSDDHGIGGAGNTIFDQDDMAGDSTAETFDAFGSALAAGDFDGDGWDDLAIGVPQEDEVIGPVSVSNCGMVHVMYGTPTGLSTFYPQGWCQGGCDGLRDTAEDGDQFGYALAAGDFNADGYDDLAIGVPYEDIVGEGGATIQDAGAVNVVYGSPNGLSVLLVPDQFWNQDITYVEGVAENWDRFGITLAAADFDDDGWDDLAIGEFYEDVGDTAPDAGAVNILYGSNYGLTTLNDQIFTQDDLQGVSAESDYFGYALAAGHLGGDRYADLVVGARNDDVDGVSAAGAVNVIYGGVYGLSATNNQYFNQGTTLEDSPEANDFFGAALAIGDLDGDGYGDLAVGVPREDLVGKTDAGAVNVIWGTSTRLSTTGNLFWSEDYAWTDMAEADEQVGFSLAAGDLDRDGDDELVIGAPYDDITYNAAGSIDIVEGYSDWGYGGVYGYSQDSGGVGGMAEPDDHFGMSLAIGDFHGARVCLPIVVRDH